ncbi:MAG: hypothetical protein ACRDMZ_03325, partial [Solirubrobacteraceae bacterium]
KRVPRDDLDLDWSSAIVTLAANPSDQQLEAIIDRLGVPSTPGTGAAALQNDLAVAYLIRAGKRRDAMSLFLALEHVERAYAHDSTSPVIAFNRSLVLERLHLFESADIAWQALATRVSDRGWRDEIAAHIATLAEARRAGTPLKSSRIADATSDLQSPREWVLDSAIRSWAQSRRGGNSAEARATLASITAVGATIVARVGDSSVTHIARDLEHADANTPRAVSLFVDAEGLYRRGEITAAAPMFLEASRLLRNARLSALAGWVEIRLMGVDQTQSKFDSVEARSARLARAARSRRDLALTARAYWLRALAEARLAKAAESDEDYRTALGIFQKLGERTNEAAMSSQRGDILFLLGRD